MCVQYTLRLWTLAELRTIKSLPTDSLWKNCQARRRGGGGARRRVTETNSGGVYTARVISQVIHI